MLLAALLARVRSTERARLKLGIIAKIESGSYLWAKNARHAACWDVLPNKPASQAGM